MNRPVALGLVDWRLPCSGVEAVALTARMGLQHLQVDMGGPGRTPELWPQRVALAQASQRYGVHIGAVACNRLNDLGLYHDAHARQVRQWIDNALDTAYVVGAPLILVPAFRNSRIVNDEQLRATARMLAWACDRASTRGLAVAHESDLGADATLRLVNQVRRHNFTLLLDPHNLMNAGHCLPTLLAQLTGHWCPQVHLKGTIPSPAAMNHLLASLTLPVHRCRFFLEYDYRLAPHAALAHDLHQTTTLLNHPLLVETQRYAATQHTCLAAGHGRYPGRLHGSGVQHLGPLRPSSRAEP